MKPSKFYLSVVSGIALGLALVSRAESAGVLSLTPAYRGVVILNEDAISPFRKPVERASQVATLAAKTIIGTNTSSVLTRFHEAGLTGVIPTQSGHAGLIVLGGDVFREGQELVTFDAFGRQSPLVPDHKVILRLVSAHTIELSATNVKDSTPATIIPVVLLEFRGR